MVISAIVGVEGLEATYEAVRLGKRVGLANKEVLVVRRQAGHGRCELPAPNLCPSIASTTAPTNACAPALRDQVSKLILTASGGPFRKLRRHDLKFVTPEQALNHPTWRMGQSASPSIPPLS
jgi:1-deoxy-D-xylulose-5-phosphate reductoisomerase